MSNLSTEGNYTMLMRQSAADQKMDMDGAVRYLKENARLRSVHEILARVCGMEGADKKALKKALLARLERTWPSMARASMERNLSNWLSDDVWEIRKSSAIQLAYALCASRDDAETLLRRLCGESFHWRDPEDIVWLFGLGSGLSYEDALALKEALSAEGLLSLPEKESTESMTAIIREEVSNLSTEADLKAFLAQSARRLGKMHNTAYAMFLEFMDLLQKVGEHTPGSKSPTPGGRKSGRDQTVPEEREMSVREVIATYMFNEYIPRAERTGKRRKGVEEDVLSAIRRSIRLNWPDETTLSKMKTREVDVTRKVMILLFMATDGGESEYADYGDIEADEAFQSMGARLDLMLADCGFAPLDPRAHFDWMVLYCMCADESIFVDANMQRFLEGIFSESAAPDDSSE